MALAAGSMNTRVRLERRAGVSDDGYGNVLEDWQEVATRWARWRPQFGREAMAAGRLEAARLGVLSLRTDATVAAITEADRVVFLVGPEKDRVGNIRSALPGDESIELTLEIGVAT